MRQRLMLIVGARRGSRLSDTCSSLSKVADVLVVTAEELIAGGADRPPEPPAVESVVLADSADDLVDVATQHGTTHAVDGVLTFSDDMVEVTASVAAALGRPGQPPETVHRFRDKAVQRAALAGAGLAVPAYAEILAPTSDHVDAALAAVPLPAILKPTRASGGALAFVVVEASELRPLVDNGFAEAGGAGGAVEPDTGFILESLIVGCRWHEVDGFAPYVSVETAAIDGRYVHLAVTDRFPLAPPVLETGMMLPSSLRDDQRRQVTAVADTALRALDFRHGIAHTELMLTADGPVVIEVNARAGGAVPYLFPIATGIDLTALAGRVALGEQPAPPARFERHAVFVAPQHPRGVEVLEVEGIDRLGSFDGVRAVIPLALGGASTQSPQQTSMMCVVLGAVDRPEQAVAMHRAVLETVRASYLPAELPQHYRRTPEGMV